MPLLTTTLTSDFCNKSFWLDRYSLNSNKISSNLVTSILIDRSVATASSLESAIKIIERLLTLIIH